MNKLLRSVLVALVLVAAGAIAPATASAATIQVGPIVLHTTGWDWTGGGH